MIKFITTPELYNLNKHFLPKQTFNNMFRHYILILAGLIGFIGTATAQIEFTIEYEKTNQRYVVSIIPDKTYKIPANLVGTSQVSIKAFTGKFFPTRVTGLYPGVEWAFNSRSNAPDEAPEYDYLSFNLLNAGLIHLPLEKGIALPVLAFSNELGCGSPVTLVDNDVDPFMPPNSKHANIGNSMAVLGIAANAYGGVNSHAAIADCAAEYTHTNKTEEFITAFDLYPIPAETEIFLEFFWGYPQETVRADVVDALGRTMSYKSIDLTNGENLHPFQIGKLAAGTYFLKLTGANWSVTLDKFQKIRY